MTVLIFGCAGQDGTLLTNLLLAGGNRVFGTDLSMPPGYAGEFAPLNLGDSNGISTLISKVRPDEIYHLAAYHHSSEQRQSNAAVLAASFDINVVSLAHVLDAMTSLVPGARLFYAASSRVFGKPSISPQSESTAFAPICDYGISKAAAIYLSRIYRQTRSAFVSVGILYNHESPLRPPWFITRKLSQAAARAKLGLEAQIQIRDGRARVDWGAAEDYVEAMSAMLKLPEPDDFVVATGETHSVSEFADMAFSHVGLNAREFVDDAATGAPELVTDVPVCGDASRLRARTGWKPRKSLARIAADMVDTDMRLISDLLVAGINTSHAS